MYTLQGFDDNYIQNLYKNVVLYSIMHYEVLPESMKLMFQGRYDYALLLKEEFNIIDIPSLEDLKQHLDEEKERIKMIQSENQPVIDQLVSNILGLMMIKMPEDLTMTEKCEYIFDYVTNTMRYANEWKRYCKDVPQNEYDFSFYQGIPVSNTFEGLLVTKQGNSDDIANLMVYLGRKLGVNIEKTFCRHNKKRYAINYINQNGTVSYIDATSVIQNEKSKEEALFVSGSVLAKNKDYQFEENGPMSVTLEKTEVPYNIQELISGVNKMMPEINYITEEKYEK